ncbi:RHS repeat-associated core domain-containing protein [Ligaoa zhengdingensis]|uniref:RHS repeat-associated core domain-containing protein n=1 Tax=Ligaoa zhengdingensis TaxID=2763658 RepID=UPI0031BA0BEA
MEFDATVSEYDVWNRQVKVTNDAGTSSYAYYPDGLRYSKTVNGALLRQVWDGTNLAYEYTLGEEDAVVPVRRYARGINAIYVESGDAKSYYLYNAHGDVVQLTDAIGTVTQEYEYDAFGNEQNPSANDMNPMRYCGEYFDAETGTIYLRARYYDPSIGRFTSADTVLQIMVELSSGIEVPDPLSLNRYTYCHNNPVMYVDQNGHWIIKDFLQWKVRTIDLPALQYTQKKLSQLDGTLAVGYTLAATPSFWDLSIQVGFAVDYKGDFVMQISYGGGVTSDSPSASLVRYYSVSNAPSVEALKGSGYAIGGSTSATHITAGADINIYPNDLNGVYWGITRFTGATTATVGGEGHINWGGTYNIVYEDPTTKNEIYINIYDLIYNVYNQILDWQ